MYVGAFFISWSVQTSAVLLFVLTGKYFFWHIFVAIALAPSQGFFNMIIYKLLKYQQSRRRKRRELTLQQPHHPTTSGRRTSPIRSRCLSVLQFFNSTNPNSNNTNNTLPNEVQEEDLTSEDGNAADQTGDVDDDVSWHVHKQLPSTSFPKDQQPPSDSKNATSEC